MPAGHEKNAAFAVLLLALACSAGTAPRDGGTAAEGGADRPVSDQRPSDRNDAAEPAGEVAADVPLVLDARPDSPDAGADIDIDIGPTSDAGSDGADAAVVCGARICAPGQLCLHECGLCGAPPPCVPAPDGGVCGPGDRACTMPATGGPGCERDCSPPPPRCIDLAPSCRPVTCACFAGQIACGSVSGGQVIGLCPP